MPNKNFEGYVVDTITLVKEQARAAKKEVNHPKKGFKEYNQGTLIA